MCSLEIVTELFNAIDKDLYSELYLLIRDTRRRRRRRRRHAVTA
jgi:hypothetical protein